VHWLRRARAERGGTADELVQFIGIDNGFYNAFVYLTLSRLALRHGLLDELPGTRTITNQYFLLEGRKFSTSKGDVLWAREYLERVGRDRARFVLALTSPELQQSEFTEQVASQTLRDRFDEPLTAIGSWLSVLRGRRVDAEPSGWWAAALKASAARFEAAYDLDRFSIRRAAEALALHLEVLRLGLEQMRVDDRADVSGALSFLWALRTLAWPVTPDLAAQVAAAFAAASAEAPLLTEVHAPPPAEFRGLPAAVPAHRAPQVAPQAVPAD
jgi:methionyl-tRNA synthetase